MGALWAMNEQCRLEASHWLPHLPASHSRRSYGARIGRSAYAVAERRRRLEAPHRLSRLPTSHSRRGYGTLAVSTSTRPIRQAQGH